MQIQQLCHLQDNWCETQLNQRQTTGIQLYSNPYKVGKTTTLQLGLGLQNIEKFISGYCLSQKIVY